MRHIIATAVCLGLGGCADSVVETFGLNGYTATTDRETNPLITEDVEQASNGVGITSRRADRATTYHFELDERRRLNVAICSQLAPPVSVDLTDAASSALAIEVIKEADRDSASVQNALTTFLSAKSNDIESVPMHVRYLDAVRATLCEYMVNTQVMGAGADQERLFATLDAAIVKAGAIAETEALTRPDVVREATSAMTPEETLDFLKRLRELSELKPSAPSEGEDASAGAADEAGAAEADADADADAVSPSDPAATADDGARETPS